MPWLNPELRCNGCGTPLPAGETENCPACRSPLAEVGVWSELKEWEITRGRGRFRYVWVRYVFVLGVLCPSLIYALTALIQQRFQPVAYYVLLISSSVLAGWLLGRLQWAGSEREYHQAQEQQVREQHRDAL